MEALSNALRHLDFLPKEDAEVLFQRARQFGHARRFQDELATYEEIVQRFGDSNKARLQKFCAAALLNEGSRLGGLKRFEEELGAYEEVVRRFGEANEPPLRQLVAMALVNKGIRLGGLGQRFEEELEIYDGVLRRFGEASEAPIREQVAKALVNKGVGLGEVRDKTSVENDGTALPGATPPEATASALPEQNDAGASLRIRCPLCAWEPAPGTVWSCSCGYRWDTFETGGICPACLKRWETTECFGCSRSSPHSNWYQY